MQAPRTRAGERVPDPDEGQGLGGQPGRRVGVAGQGGVERLVHGVAQGVEGHGLEVEEELPDGVAVVLGEPVPGLLLGRAVRPAADGVRERRRLLLALRDPAGRPEVPGPEQARRDPYGLPVMGERRVRADQDTVVVLVLVVARGDHRAVDVGERPTEVDRARPELPVVVLASLGRRHRTGARAGGSTTAAGSASRRRVAASPRSRAPGTPSAGRPAPAPVRSCRGPRSRSGPTTPSGCPSRGRGTRRAGRGPASGPAARPRGWRRSPPGARTSRPGRARRAAPRTAR